MSVYIVQTEQAQAIAVRASSLEAAVRLARRAGHRDVEPMIGPIRSRAFYASCVFNGGC